MQGFLRTSEREGLITSRQRLDFPGGSAVKIRPQCRRCQFSPGGSGRPPGAGHGNPLSVLPREVPWAEEPGGLPSAGSHRVGPTQRLNSSHEAVSRAALLSAPEGFGGRDAFGGGCGLSPPSRASPLWRHREGRAGGSFSVLGTL